MRLSKWLSRRSKSRIPSRWLGVENLEDRSVPAGFTAGNLLVYRVGDGGSALTNSAMAAFLDEYTPSGTLVQSIAVPVADSGANLALTNAGTAASEGYLTLSVDGAYAVFTGYNAAPATASVAGTSSATVKRVIGRVDSAGVIDTSTSTTSFSGGNPRGIASTDGSNFWLTGSNTGVVYTTLGGSGAGTIVASNAANTRVAGIYGGQLYVSSGSAAFAGVNTVGTGLPTTSGNTTVLLNGLGNTTNVSNYGFYFADLNPSVPGVDTLYTADDGNVTTSTGGISKFSLVAGSWVSNGRIATSPYRGLTGVVSGSSVTLFATTGPSSGVNALATFTDTTGYNAALSGSFTSIATAATNTAFRGVTVVPQAASSPPTVLSVSANKPNNTYGIGQVIPVQVTFSSAVTVTGTPQLKLETGSNDAILNYASGSGSDTLVFNYTVGAGDTSPDLDYFDTASLTLNGGTIKSGSLAANLTLPAVGSANSLGGKKDLVIDGIRPVVSSVSGSSANGTYILGQSINITVNFSENVTVSGGTPTLTLETGATDRAVSYLSGSGTSTLTFRYTVQSGDQSTDLDYLASNPLQLNGATIQDAAGNDSNASGAPVLPPSGSATSLSGTQDYAVNGVVPTVTNVAANSLDGTYIFGQVVDIAVSFSEPVTITGLPTLRLETGAADRDAVYLSGDGSGTLVFRYTVQDGDESPDLNYVDASSLIGTIKNIVGNAATLTLPAIGGTGSLGTNSNILVDGFRPHVASVASAAADGTYAIGQTLALTVTFDQAVFVTGGPPQLLLETGSTDQAANYVSGTGTNVLTFNYTVQPGDLAGHLDYVSSSALGLNGGTILDANGNSALLGLAAPGDANSLGANANIVIDGVGPTITNVTSVAANGSYPAGTVIDITVSFDEIVNVSGSPTLLLETGAVDQSATYQSGSGSNVLTFRYIVQPGDNTPALDYLGTDALTGGTIQDESGNTADRTLPAPGAAGSLSANRNITVDTLVPTVLNVSSTNADKAWGQSRLITLTVLFSEPVNVTGTPTILLETGATDRTATYSGGSGTNTLSFQYTVQDGDASPDLDYTSTSSLSGAIADFAGNAAVLTLPAPGSAGSLGANKNLIVDGIQPVITNVTSTNPDGSYKLGDVITITVQFSEPVFVFDSPILPLNTSPTANWATYSSGSGTNLLTFLYTVGLDDQSSHLDYFGFPPVLLGTIADAAFNADDSSLAHMGAPGSLGFNKNIVVDGTAPTLTGFTPNNTTPTNAGTVSWTLSFSEPVVGVDTAVANGEIFLSPGGGVLPGSLSVSGGGNSWTITANTGTGDGTLSLDILNIGTIQDANGNPLAAPPSISGPSYTIDKSGPTVYVDTPGQQDPTSSQPISFRIVFSEPVDSFDSSKITLSGTAIRGGESVISTDTGDHMTFDVTVSGLSTDGSVTVSVVAGVVQDAAGNANAASLPVDGTVLYDASSPSVVSLAPIGPGITNSPTAQFRVQFSESVSGVDTDPAGGFANFSLVLIGGVSGSSITSITQDADPRFYTITVNTGAGEGQLRLDLTSTTGILDAVGNSLVSTYTGDANLIVDLTVPTAAFETTPALRNTPLDSILLDFSEAVSAPLTGDFTLTRNGNPVSLSGLTITPSGNNFTLGGLTSATAPDGAYMLTFHGITSAVADDAGNHVSSDASVSFTVDTTGPTATLTEPTSGPTNAGSLNFTVTLSEPVFGLVQGNFGVVTTGSISGAAVTGFAPTANPLVYTVTVNPGTGVGTIRLTASNAPAITDLAGNSPTNLPASSGTVSIDTVAPTMSIDDGDTDNLVKAGLVLNYTVDVTDANPGSFTVSAANVSNAGTAGISVGTVASSAIAGGTRFTIPVSTLTGGTLILRINAGASLTDLAGNSVSLPASDNDTLTVDATVPSVTVNPAPGQALLTNTQPVQFVVSFSEPVVGFGTSSFLLSGTAGNVAGASVVVTNPTADNQNFIVTVSSLTGDGTLTLTVPAGAVTDIAGNSNTVSTGSDTVMLDITAPVVTGITRFNPSASLTNAAQVVYQVTFSDPVTGVDATDFFLTTTGLSGSTVGSVSGSNTTWFVTVNSGNGEGTIKLNVTDNDSIRDSAANRLGGTGVNNGNFTAGEIYNVDRTLPSVSSMTRLDPTITNLGTVRWLVTFSEPVQVSTVSGADFIPFGSGVTFGTVSASQVHSGANDNQFIVTIASVVGNGSLALNVSGGSATILDPTGNSLGQSFSGPAYTIDQTAPGVLVNLAASQSALVSTQPLNFQIVFSEPIGTFGAAQITRSGTAGGLAGATIVVTNPSADLKTFVVTVSGLTGDGTVTLAVSAGVVNDTAGNPNTASGGSNDTITLDTTPPAVSTPALDPLSDSGISQTDNITNDTTPTFQGTAEPGATVVLFAGGNVLGTTTAVGGTWTVTTSVLPEGVYNMKARATDAAGNVAESTFVAPVTIDTTGPTAVVTRATGQAPAITVGAGGASIQFSVVFSQDVAGLTASDVVVGGTAGGTISNVSGSGAAYLVTVGGLTQPGTVTVNVHDSVGVDLAGNAGTASPAGESVTATFLTQTQVLVSPPSITAGGSATVTATVAAPAGTVPTGAILFSLNGPGGIITRTVSLSAGAASTTFTSLLAGSFTVTAAYQPDAGYVSSTAGTGFTVAPGSGGGGGGGGGASVDANAIGEYTAIAGRTVTVYNPDGTVKRSFQPFSASEAPGGVRAAIADVNGDGTPDIAVVTGPGAAARLRVYDGITNGLLYARTLFEGFPGGAFVAAGDLTGDHKADLAVTPDQGGGSRVMILNGPDGAVITNFLGIDDANFRGGIRAAIGDLNNDGINDVLVSAGFGGGPRVAGFNGVTLLSTGAKLFPDFFLFESTLRNGAYVSVGDLNDDGWGDIIGGGGPGGAPRVLVYDSKALIQNHNYTPLANFYAGSTDLRGGIRVAAKDFDGDGHSDLVTGSGDNGQMLVYFGVDLLAGDTHPARHSLLGGVIDGVYVG